MRALLFVALASCAIEPVTEQAPAFTQPDRVTAGCSDANEAACTDTAPLADNDAPGGDRSPAPAPITVPTPDPIEDPVEDPTNGPDEEDPTPTPVDDALFPPGTVRRGWRIGNSVQERPMLVELYGNEGPIVLIMTAIHGDERTAVAVGEMFRAQLQRGLAEETHAQVLLVTHANPDGVAAPGGKRYNFHNVNLNRNFDTVNFIYEEITGTPGSEPETQALQALVSVVQPDTSVSVHSPINAIDYDGPGLDMATRMSEASGFIVKKLGAYPGSFGSYMGVDGNRPAVTFELPQTLPSHAAYAPSLAALRAALEYTADTFMPRDPPAFDPSDDTYVAWDAPSRVEATSLAPQQPVVLVTDTHPPSPTLDFVTGRIRQALLVRKNAPPLVIVSGTSAATQSVIARAKPWIVLTLAEGPLGFQTAGTVPWEALEIGDAIPNDGVITDANAIEALGYPTVRLSVPQFPYESMLNPVLNALQGL